MVTNGSARNQALALVENYLLRFALGPRMPTNLAKCPSPQKHSCMS